MYMEFVIFAYFNHIHIYNKIIQYISHRTAHTDYGIHYEVTNNNRKSSIEKKIHLYQIYSLLYHFYYMLYYLSMTSSIYLIWNSIVLTENKVLWSLKMI